jgi:hypothetical protein
LYLSIAKKITMNAIGEIINIMNIEDRRAFMAYLQKKNTRKDAGNIKLFKLLETDDINALKNNFTTKKSADAYHALNKRLYDNMIEFMGNRTFETATGEAHEVLRLLQVSRLFFEHQLTKTAFKCLVKAEAKALPLEQFSLLNEIYHTQVQYAHLNPTLDLALVMEKFKENREKLYREEQLNLGYALLRKELIEIQHKGKVVDFRAFIVSTMESLGISLNEILTFKSLYQILFMANEYATINSNFTLVAPFVEKSYSFIAHKQELAGKQLYYHIYILYFMANINFRNHRFAESEAYLDRMMEQMQKQNRQYYSRFALRYFLLLSLNKNFGGAPGQAMHIAEKALKEAGKKADPVDVNDLRICIAMFCLQQSDRTAAKYMRQFAHTDSWYEKKMGMLWTIRKALLEILMHTEFGNTELALSRLKSFKRRYKKYLAEVKEDRVMQYALMVEKYILKPEMAIHPQFKPAIMAMLTPELKEDIFVLSFLGWLLGKATKKTTYEATLELMAI